MVKTRLKIAIILITFFTISVFSKNFEGTLSYIKECGNDTSYVYWFIKGNKVRIEEYNRFHEISSTVLVDIEKEISYQISPDQKLYTPYEQNKIDLFADNNFQITKSNNYKIINGTKCYQWRVRNQAKNTEITYWVTRDSFSIYNKTILSLNKTDNSICFFKKIPEYQGYLPLLCEERTLLRDTRSKKSLIKITKKEVSNSLFVIPSDYKLLIL